MSLQGLWYNANPWVWLLSPLALLFVAAARTRRWLYRHDWLRRYRPPVPVLVVGNLTVGGNGKTPVVIWLVELLQQAGFRPGVVSRGYGGRAAHYPLLLTAETPAAEAGDEPVLIRRRCGCPVAVDANRAAAVQALLAGGQVDVIVCDDGLQHYALARDLELVVVDGERRFGNGFPLPMGPMREGRWRLGEVDAILCNGGTPRPGEQAMQLASEPPRRVCDDVAVPAPTRIAAMAGIGHPPRFFATLQRLGYQLQQTVAYADHQAFDAEALRRRFGERPLLMTEKDAVKCRAFAPENWWYLPISARLPDALAAMIIRKTKECAHGTGSQVA